MINECINLLREREVKCIKGNHDSYLLGESKCLRSNSVNRCIEYQKNVITQAHLEWIKSLKSSYTNSVFSLVHGGWHDNTDEYIDTFNFLDPILSDYKVDIFISGHTHKQILQCSKEKIYCNPGSVGQPRDYIWKSAFAVLENKDIKLYRVEYDIEKMAYEMKKAGFNDYYYNNLFYGCKIGERI